MLDSEGMIYDFQLNNFHSQLFIFLYTYCIPYVHILVHNTTISCIIHVLVLVQLQRAMFATEPLLILFLSLSLFLLRLLVLVLLLVTTTTARHISHGALLHARDDAAHATLAAEERDTQLAA